MQRRLRIVGAIAGMVALSQACGHSKAGDHILDMRPLKATATRVGNSIGGLDPRPGATFPDGAPIRAKVPMTAEAVWLEADGRTVRVFSRWNEGGYHTTWFRDGKYLGGAFDVPPEHLPDWLSLTKDRKTLAASGRKPVPLNEVKGYSWVQTPTGRLTIKTPTTTYYSLVQTDNVVPDPKDPNTLYTSKHRLSMDWQNAGAGREWKFVSDTVSPSLYPSDPRLNIHVQGSHRTTFRCFYVGDVKYLASGANTVDLHRWDAAKGLWVPSASVQVRPPESDMATRSWPPKAPKVEWGGGLSWRDRDGDGQMEPGEYEKWSVPGLWNEFEVQVSPGGALWWMPYSSDAKKGSAYMLPRAGFLDEKKNPLYRTEELEKRALPAHLRSSDDVGMTRVHWETGDLIAIYRKGSTWNLSLYPGWTKASDPARIAPRWSTAQVASQMRRGVPPNAKFRYEMCGSIVSEGDYVFLAEAIGCGVRVYRRSDGKPVGRMFDKGFANSTVDEPRGGLHAWRRGSGPTAEYVVSVMDFNGSAAALWRVQEDELRR